MNNKIIIKSELLYFPKDTIMYTDSDKKKIPIKLYINFDTNFFDIKIPIFTNDSTDNISYYRNIGKDEGLFVSFHLDGVFRLFCNEDIFDNNLDFFKFIKSIKENKKYKLNLMISGWDIYIEHDYIKDLMKSIFYISMIEDEDSDFVCRVTESIHQVFELHDSEKGFLDYLIFKDNKIFLNHDLKNKGGNLNG